MMLERSYAPHPNYPPGFLARQALWFAYTAARGDGFRRRVTRTGPLWQVYRLAERVPGRAGRSPVWRRTAPDGVPPPRTVEALRMAHRAQVNDDDTGEPRPVLSPEQHQKMLEALGDAHRANGAAPEGDGTYRQCWELWEALGDAHRADGARG